VRHIKPALSLFGGPACLDVTLSGDCSPRFPAKKSRNRGFRVQKLIDARMDYMLDDDDVVYDLAEALREAEHGSKFRIMKPLSLSDTVRSARGTVRPYTMDDEDYEESVRDSLADYNDFDEEGSGHLQGIDEREEVVYDIGPVLRPEVETIGSPRLSNQEADHMVWIITVAGIIAIVSVVTVLYFAISRRWRKIEEQIVEKREQTAASQRAKAARNRSRASAQLEEGLYTDSDVNSEQFPFARRALEDSYIEGYSSAINTSSNSSTPVMDVRANRYKR